MELFADGPIAAIVTGAVTLPRNPALSAPGKQR